MELCLLSAQHELNSLHVIDREHISANSPELHSEINTFLPDYTHILCASLSYNCSFNNLPDSTPFYIARYTAANFYKILYKKLDALAKLILDNDNIIENKKSHYKISVNGRLKDREIALKTGGYYMTRNSLVGTIGDNSGTKIILGELVIKTKSLPAVGKYTSSAELHPFCKECRLCVKSCPTGSLKTDSTIDKDRCIQHLSSTTGTGNLQLLIDNWGKRFFGCTRCVDVCPINKDLPVINIDSPEKLPGFIGGTFNPFTLLGKTKEQVKETFRGNQLGAEWIPAAAIMRNALISVYKSSGDKTIVENYVAGMEKLGFDRDEIAEIEKLLTFLC